MPRRRTLMAAALALGFLGAACTSDSPQTDLPCEFYLNQRDSGVDVDIPVECDEGTPATEAPVEE